MSSAGDFFTLPIGSALAAPFDQGRNSDKHGARNEKNHQNK